MSEIILDSAIDSIKLLPFLFLTYLFMDGWNIRQVQRHATESAQQGSLDRYGEDFWV